MSILDREFVHFDVIVEFIHLYFSIGQITFLFYPELMRQPFMWAPSHSGNTAQYVTCSTTRSHPRPYACDHHSCLSVYQSIDRSDSIGQDCALARWCNDAVTGRQGIFVLAFACLDIHSPNCELLVRRESRSSRKELLNCYLNFSNHTQAYNWW